MRDPRVAAPLLEQLPGVERLVLLGDVVELRQGPAADALRLAGPVLSTIAEALPSTAEVVVVPGNHDHRLLAGWFERRALAPDSAPLGSESAVDWRPDEPLEAVAEALGSERVRVLYPGIWLSAEVYATHGHYGDRHTTMPILERLGAGVVARISGEPPGGPVRAEDYEATLAPLYAWIDAIAEHGGLAVPGSEAGMQGRLWQRMSRRRRHRVGSWATMAAFRTAVALLNRAGIGPLRADLSSGELRRAALRGFMETLRRLGVGPEHVIFGHTHRAGPLPGDDRSEWTTGRRTSLWNTGSWIHEPAFLGRVPHESPYRVGFCVLLDGAKAPQLVNLVDRPVRA